jgi:Winged helix-turn-helix DNA-binding
LRGVNRKSRLTPPPERGEARKDVSLRTAQMVRLITQVGPDIPEIARRLGQFKESVRYRYKTKLLERGFAVQGMVDHEKLGLKRIAVVVDFADELVPHVQAIALAMNQLCYVVNYAKTVPDGRFIIHASVPAEHVPSFIEMISALKDRGVFKSTELFVFEWFRNIPMRAEFYDFNSGMWDFDWTAPSNQKYAAASYEHAQKGKFDYTDLLIIEELQQDASKSLTEIAQKLNVNYKKLAWHYSTHVVGKRLVKGYRINWMGTRYDTKVERALHRRHRYIFVNVFVRGLAEVERMELMSEINKLPFLWAEAAGDSYFAQLAFPVDNVAEGLQFVQRALEPVRDRASFYFEDTSEALAFTITHQLYDPTAKKWLFNPETVLGGFNNLVLKIKEGGGREPQAP